MARNKSSRFGADEGLFEGSAFTQRKTKQEVQEEQNAQDTQEVLGADSKKKQINYQKKDKAHEIQEAQEVHVSTGEDENISETVKNKTQLPLGAQQTPYVHDEHDVQETPYVQHTNVQTERNYQLERNKQTQQVQVVQEEQYVQNAEPQVFLNTQQVQEVHNTHGVQQPQEVQFIQGVQQEQHIQQTIPQQGINPQHIQYVQGVQVVQQEQQIKKEIGSTQGKKGQKLKRINMAFSDDNHYYVTHESRRRGISATAFVNMIIDQYKAGSDGNIMI